MLDFNKVGKPLAATPLWCRRCLIFCLVLPVGRDSGLGNAIHFDGSDLHFQRQALGPEQCRVQRLITVKARNSNVILESSRHRFIQIVYNAQHLVAGVHIIENDTKTIYIDDVF